MKKTTILTGVLIVLVLVSIVQGVQLNSLKGVIADGKLTVKSAGSSLPAAGAATSSGNAASVPKSIQNLPQMVGGC